MFKPVLEQLVRRVEGARGALVMGLDGLTVEQVRFGAELDLEGIATELSPVLVGLLKSARELQLGALEEVSLRLEKLVLVARWINPEYFVVIALVADGNFGRARFELRKAVLSLHDQF